MRIRYTGPLPVLILNGSCLVRPDDELDLPDYLAHILLRQPEWVQVYQEQPPGELEDVPGIGHELAQALRAQGVTTQNQLARMVLAPENREALLDVPGIGPRKLEALAEWARDYFAVEEES